VTTLGAREGELALLGHPSRHLSTDEFLLLLQLYQELLPLLLFVLIPKLRPLAVAIHLIQDLLVFHWLNIFKFQAELGHGEFCNLVILAFFSLEELLTSAVTIEFHRRRIIGSPGPRQLLLHLLAVTPHVHWLRGRVRSWHSLVLLVFFRLESLLLPAVT